MFRVSLSIEKKPIIKKKLFVSSNTSAFDSDLFSSTTEPKKNNRNQNLPDILPLSASMCKNNDLINEGKNCNKTSNNNAKILPMKKIRFQLYKVNLLKPKKEKIQKTKVNKQNLKHNQPLHQTNKIRTITYNNEKYSAGRWKKDEHKRFIDAIIKYGNNWRQVQKYVGTRSSTQTRSHAQKFFEKLKKSRILKVDVDFSKNSLKILHDVMKKLPNKEFQKTLKALHSLSYERTLNKNVECNYEYDINYNEKNIIIENYDLSKNQNSLINTDNNLHNENNENKNTVKNEKINNNNNDEENTQFNAANKDYYYYQEKNTMYRRFDDDYFMLNNNNNYLNLEVKSMGRRDSDIFSLRKNSLCDLNVKDQPTNNALNNNEIALEKPFNNEYICQPLQENKININKQLSMILEEKNEKEDYRQLNNIDYILCHNMQGSRKMSLDDNSAFEKLTN